MKQETVFANFNNYDEDGRRIAVFGTVNDNVLTIKEYLTSSKDQFNKTLAWAAFNEVPIWEHKFVTNEEGEKVCQMTQMEFHPTTTSIALQEGDKPRNIFNAFCNNNFYVKETLVMYKDKEDKIRNVRSHNGNIVLDLMTKKSTIHECKGE